MDPARRETRAGERALPGLAATQRTPPMQRMRSSAARSRAARVPRAALLWLAAVLLAAGCGDGAPDDAPAPTPTPAPVPTATPTRYETRQNLGCGPSWCPTSPAAAQRLDRLRACEPVRVGFYWTFGEAGFEAVEVSPTTCTVEVLLEEELGARLVRCELPRPVESWEGLLQGPEPASDVREVLRGIEDRCTEILSCSLGEAECAGSVTLCYPFRKFSCAEKGAAAE